MVTSWMHNTDFDIHMRIKNIDAELERFERRAVVVGTSVSTLLMLALASCLAVIGVPL